MKKTSMVIAALVFAASVPVVSMQTASAAHLPPSTNEQFCQGAVEFGLFDSIGACLNVVNRGGSGAAKACQSVRKQGLLDLFGFKNQGQCIKFLRTNANS